MLHDMGKQTLSSQLPKGSNTVPDKLLLLMIPIWWGRQWNRHHCGTAAQMTLMCRCTSFMSLCH